MIYKLSFTKSAFKEWNKLGHAIRVKFKAKLEERLVNPFVPKDRLSGFNNECFKIKLRYSGFRLVY